jgi:hypothetical protein
MVIARTCTNTYYIKVNNTYIKLKDVKIQLKKAHIKYYISSDLKFITTLNDMKTYKIIETNNMIIQGHARDNKLSKRLNNR